MKTRVLQCPACKTCYTVRKPKTKDCTCTTPPTRCVPAHLLLLPRPSVQG